MDYTRVILTVAPFIFTIGFVPLANRVHPIVLGLPFLAFWLTLSIYVAFACIWLLFRYDNRQREAGLNGKDAAHE